MREKDIQKACELALRAAGCLPIRVNSGMAVRRDRHGKERAHRYNSAPGCSDLLVCLPDGTFAAVEIKRPGNKPRPLQEAFLDDVRRHGGVALWVTSPEELLARLKEMGVI